MIKFKRAVKVWYQNKHIMDIVPGNSFTKI